MARFIHPITFFICRKLCDIIDVGSYDIHNTVFCVFRFDHLKYGGIEMKKSTLVLVCVFITLIAAAVAILFVFFGNQDEETSAEFYSVSDRPIINYSDGENVELADLEIKWNRCYGAIGYVYNCIILSGEPDYGNDNEASLPGCLVLAKQPEAESDNSFIIQKEQLEHNKWVKIAVGACYKDGSSKWSSTYIKII